MKRQTQHLEKWNQIGGRRGRKLVMAGLKMKGVGMQMVAFMLLLLISHGWISSSPLLIAEAANLNLLDVCLRYNLTTGVCDPNLGKRPLRPSSPIKRRGCDPRHRCRVGSQGKPWRRFIWCVCLVCCARAPIYINIIVDSNARHTLPFLILDWWNEAQYYAVYCPVIWISIWAILYCVLGYVHASE